MHGNTRPFRGKERAALAAVLLAIGLTVACEKENQYAAPPPPKVTIARPLVQDVVEYIEFTGATRAAEEVEVRARVSGFLQSMHFTPGTQVEKGDLLFVIDPREYKAALDAAEAEVASAKAQTQRAKIELGRAEKLFAQKAGSETEVVKWRGQRDVADAAVARAQAKVERARLDLEYTRVTSPISGRVGRNLVDLGNLVGAQEPTLLTTVTSYNPMYAYFNLNERDLLKVMDKYRAEAKSKGVDPESEAARKADLPLFLALADEEDYPHEGVFDFSESSVDPGTGTLQLRGAFPNPGALPKLVPGLFTRIRMPVEERKNALLVTERAIASDQGGSYLMVVDKDNVVEKRLVRTGQLVDGLRVVKEGIRVDDRVVVNGIQRARPGAKVAAEETDMASLKTSVSKSAKEAAPRTPGSEASSTPGKSAAKPRKSETR